MAYLFELAMVGVYPKHVELVSSEAFRIFHLLAAE